MAFFEDYGDEFLCDYREPRIIPPYVGMHIHPHYEILFNLSQHKTRSLINGKYIYVDSAFIGVFTPYCMHQTNYPTDVELSQTSIYISEKNLKNQSLFCKEGFISNISAYTFFKLTPSVAEEIKSIHDLIVQKKEFPHQQELLFWVIMNILSERLSPEDVITSPSQSWYISDIVKYMSENLSENLTLDSIAERFLISRAKLAKDFKSSTGQTIHQLLIYMRISRAAYIIRSGKYKNIQDVAEQVGMGNSYNFYQVFKKLRKVTPYQYVQRCKKQVKWYANEEALTDHAKTKK